MSDKEPILTPIQKAKKDKADVQAKAFAEIQKIMDDNDLQIQISHVINIVEKRP